MTLQLVIGNKNYSSWSLRAWLALELTGEPYEEVQVSLYAPDSRARLLAHSSSGKVPVLKNEQGVIWDSLAIAEYLAESYPEVGLWPRDAMPRALARSVCAEMHSGFTALRSALPMDLRHNQAMSEVPEAVQADIQRVCAIWAECRSRFGQGGPFLFGNVSIADAFYAPVAARLRSYGVALSTEAQAYVESIYQWPLFQRWYQAALAETEVCS